MDLTGPFEDKKGLIEPVLCNNFLNGFLCQLQKERNALRTVLGCAVRVNPFVMALIE